MKETSFRILKNKCSTNMATHGVSWDSDMRCYFDSSDFAGGFALMKVQECLGVPIIFDSFSFTSVPRGYGT